MNTTELAPFPTAPDFTATPTERRVYRAAMREAWLDRADHNLAQAQNAAGAGDYLSAEIHLADARTCVTQARCYRNQVA